MDTNYKKYHRDQDYKKYELMFRNIFQKRADMLKKYFLDEPGHKRKVLDIGASTGSFLDIYKKDWETWGVEPSGTSEVAKSKGHKIIKSFFESAHLPKNYFDLVIINHTLEHLDDPDFVLRKINSTLRHGGIVFIDVPNFGSLSSKILGKKWPYLLPAEHKWQFTKKSLSKLIKENNFKLLEWKSRSGIFEYSNPFLELQRRRFLIDLILFPYSLIATSFGMGDSMSFIAKKR